jgi:DNA-binding MarR family transcriptional regulator
MAEIQTPKKPEAEVIGGPRREYLKKSSARWVGGGGRRAALIRAWEWADQLEEHSWIGSGGASARCCAEALAHWATRRGGSVFVASIDEIALESGLSRSSTRRALRRLEAQGLVELRSSGDGRRASIWELRKGFAEAGVGSQNSGAYGGGAADWTRWRAVGKTGFLLWRACIGGASVGEIARQRGTSAGQVRRVLRRLRALGIVRYEPQTRLWWAEEAEGLAGRYKTAGAYQRELSKIEEDRRGRKLQGQIRRASVRT